MNKSTKRLFFLFSIIFISLLKTISPASKNGPQILNQDVGLSSIFNKIDFSISKENTIKYNVYGIDLYNYRSLREDPLIGELEMLYWTSDAGRETNNFSVRLYYTTHDLYKETEHNSYFSRAFVYLGSIEPKEVMVQEIFDNFPRILYVTSHPNENARAIIPIFNSDSKIYLAYDEETKEKYLVKLSKFKEIEAGNVPGQKALCMYDRDTAIELAANQEDNEIYSALYDEIKRNANVIEAQEFINIYNDIINSRVFNDSDFIKKL